MCILHNFAWVKSGFKYSHTFFIYDNDTINTSVIIDKREFRENSREAGEEDEEVEEERDKEVEEESEDVDVRVLVGALMRREVVLVGVRVREGVGAVAEGRIKLSMNQVPEVVGSEPRDLSSVKEYCK